MARSYHVTQKALRTERIEFVRESIPMGYHMTELETKDVKKRISKVNNIWKRKASKAGVPSGQIKFKKK
jgi:hypothetical protein